MARIRCRSTIADLIPLRISGELRCDPVLQGQTKNQNEVEALANQPYATEFLATRSYRISHTELGGEEGLRIWKHQEVKTAARSGALLR
jgi:hypothetical protein